MSMKKQACLFLFALIFIWNGEKNVYGRAPFLTETSFDLDIGYRWDKINVIPVALNLPIAATGVNQRFENLNSIQLGGRGLITFCHRIYIKGQGHYGWNREGSYLGQLNRAITKGSTVDALGGIGYFFSPTSYWKFSLLGGWSYDKINVTAETTPVPIVAHFRWQGPWVGFDFLFDPYDCLKFSFGYELHHACWRSRLEGTTAQLGIRSGRLRHNNFWGNVAHCRLTYLFCTRFSIGFNLRYQIWLAHGTSRWTPNVSPAGFTNLVSDISWASFSGFLNLGVTF